MAVDLKPPAADLPRPVYGLISRDIAARLLGRPLLLLPGWSQSVTMCRAQIISFAPD
ncbi:hypothetical protein WME90_09975 [Sorangium sp. So ce375]|uniref:hypothetical protein n=1 Tax=Sorangium sp. So ce375 TaxID=3133306 RepID=UPI003F5C2929